MVHDGAHRRETTLSNVEIFDDCRGYHPERQLYMVNLQESHIEAYLTRTKNCPGSGMCGADFSPANDFDRAADYLSSVSIGTSLARPVTSVRPATMRALDGLANKLVGNIVRSIALAARTGNVVVALLSWLAVVAKHAESPHILEASPHSRGDLICTSSIRPTSTVSTVLKIGHAVSQSTVWPSAEESSPPSRTSTPRSAPSSTPGTSAADLMQRLCPVLG